MGSTVQATRRVHVYFAHTRLQQHLMRSNQPRNGHESACRRHRIGILVHMIYMPRCSCRAAAIGVVRPASLPVTHALFSACCVAFYTCTRSRSIACSCTKSPYSWLTATSAPDADGGGTVSLPPPATVGGIGCGFLPQQSGSPGLLPGTQQSDGMKGPAQMNQPLCAMSVR